MSAQPPMACAECNREIKLGERYVAYVRHVEVAKPAGLLGRLRGREAIITVKDADDIRLLHPACEKTLSAAFVRRGAR